MAIWQITVMYLWFYDKVAVTRQQITSTQKVESSAILLFRNDGTWGHFSMLRKGLFGWSFDEYNQSLVKARAGTTTLRRITQQRWLSLITQSDCCRRVLHRALDITTTTSISPPRYHRTSADIVPPSLVVRWLFFSVVQCLREWFLGSEVCFGASAAAACIIVR